MSKVRRQARRSQHCCLIGSVSRTHSTHCNAPSAETNGDTRPEVYEPAIYGTALGCLSAFSAPLPFVVSGAATASRAPSGTACCTQAARTRRRASGATTEGWTALQRIEACKRLLCCNNIFGRRFAVRSEGPRAACSQITLVLTLRFAPQSAPVKASYTVPNASLVIDLMLLMGTLPPSIVLTPSCSRGA
jgi:hypothetical protein